MNQFETIQDLIDHLTALPKDVKQSPVITQKDGSASAYIALSDSSFMYVDKNFYSGQIDEVWKKEDLVESANDSDEEANILNRFKKVLVLWFE